MPITDAEKRQIHRLRGEDGQSEREIAKVVGCAPSTVHDVLQAPPPEAVNGNGHSSVSDVTPGQQTIDGGEVRVDEMAPPLEEIRVDGTTQLQAFDAGGKKPQSASLRLTGGKVLLVDGQAFKKGDVLTGTFTAVVNEVAQRDTHDPQTGIVVSAEQKHSARITDLTVE